MPQAHETIGYYDIAAPIRDIARFISETSNSQMICFTIQPRRWIRVGQVHCPPPESSTRDNEPVHDKLKS